MNIYDIKNFEKVFRPQFFKSGFLWISVILVNHKIIKVLRITKLIK